MPYYCEYPIIHRCLLDGSSRRQCGFIKNHTVHLLPTLIWTCCVFKTESDLRTLTNLAAAGRGSWGRSRKGQALQTLQAESKILLLCSHIWKKQWLCKNTVDKIIIINNRTVKNISMGHFKGTVGKHTCYRVTVNMRIQHYGNLFTLVFWCWPLWWPVL